MSLIKVRTHSHDRARSLAAWGQKHLKARDASKYLPLPERVRGTGRLPRRCFAVFVSCVIQRASPCELDPVTARRVRVCARTHGHTHASTHGHRRQRWRWRRPARWKQLFLLFLRIFLSCDHSPFRHPSARFPHLWLDNQPCVILSLPPLFHRSETLFQFSCRSCFFSISYSLCNLIMSTHM